MKKKLKSSAVNKKCSQCEKIVAGVDMAGLCPSCYDIVMKIVDSMIQESNKGHCRSCSYFEKQDWGYALILRCRKLNNMKFSEIYEKDVKCKKWCELTGAPSWSAIKIEEGKVKKGGVNPDPSIPKPKIKPAGQRIEIDTSNMMISKSGQVIPKKKKK